VEIDFLRHYGLDKTVTDLLRDHYGADLLPVQETAFVENNLFDGTNMVVSAPTSSGKTLIGEVAALHHIEHDRRALVLVPTKALAYEKYEHFQRLYQQPLGIRVVLSSRDHRERDREIPDCGRSLREAAGTSGEISGAFGISRSGGCG